MIPGWMAPNLSWSSCHLLFCAFGPFSTTHKFSQRLTTQVLGLPIQAAALLPMDQVNLLLGLTVTQIPPFGLLSHRNSMHKRPAAFFGRPRIPSFSIFNAFGCSAFQVSGTFRVAQARSDRTDENLGLSFFEAQAGVTSLYGDGLTGEITGTTLSWEWMNWSVTCTMEVEILGDDQKEERCEETCLHFSRTVKEAERHSIEY